MIKIEDELVDIIKGRQIRTVFQPIISLKDGSILGHEALSRIAGNDKNQKHSITDLFDAAKKFKQLTELEHLCRTTALNSAYIDMKPQYSKKLFLNINAYILLDDSFERDFLIPYNKAPYNIVLDVSEQDAVDDMPGLLRTIDYYKCQGYKLCIDDVGSGYAGLNLITETNPNYIKINMDIIRDINMNNSKYSLVKSLKEFSSLSNIAIIAEGVETESELESLIELGVQYAQGFYIQEPDEQIKDIDPKLIDKINKKNEKFFANISYKSSTATLYIKNICSPVVTVSPDEMVPVIYETLINNTDMIGLCVVEDEIPLGIVTKEKLTLQLSGQYGFALNQYKNISKLMDKNYLSVDYQTTLNIVSKMAMSRPSDNLYDFIVVTRHDKLYGVVTVKDLLETTTEIEISAARHLNPLTGLPGNLMIEEKLTECVASGDEYTVAYIDIDNFKPYNDVYGFKNGDHVIQLLADTISNNLTNNHFIGHVGGDDFVVILRKHVSTEYFTNIIRDFEKKVLDFFNKTDARNGYITTKNRQGTICKLPLTTLTIVSVSNSSYSFIDEASLSETLALLKSEKKQNKLEKFRMTVY